MSARLFVLTVTVGPIAPLNHLWNIKQKQGEPGVSRLHIVMPLYCRPWGSRSGFGYRCLFLLASLLFTLTTVAHSAVGKEVEEKYPAGQTRATYNIKNGSREGPFTELYENGTTKVKAFYKGDLLAGKYTTFFDNGKPHESSAYHLGRLQGKLTEFNKVGEVVAKQTTEKDCSKARKSFTNPSFPFSR